MTRGLKVTLWEAYCEGSNYFPRLRQEMMTILEKSGDGVCQKEEVIKHFCQTQGERVLSSREDYILLVELFKAFLEGMVWGLSKIAPSRESVPSQPNTPTMER